MQSLAGGDRPACVRLCQAVCAWKRFNVSAYPFEKSKKVALLESATG